MNQLSVAAVQNAQHLLSSLTIRSIVQRLNILPRYISLPELFISYFYFIKFEGHRDIDIRYKIGLYIISTFLTLKYSYWHKPYKSGSN